MLNPNYKQFFEITTDIARTTLISLMSDPVNIPDKEMIKLYRNDGSYDDFTTRNLEKDLNKMFLNELINSKSDYLIIDNLFESRFGILCSDEGIMTNNEWDLPRTSFYNTLTNKKTLSMKNNSSKYFKLFKEHCTYFFDFIDKNCADLNIILNNVSDSEKILKNDGTIYTIDSVKNYCDETNPITYKLNKYIENNFEVKTIELNIVNYPNDENHAWGIGTSHFIPQYYIDFTTKLNKIIYENNQINNFKNIMQKQENKLNILNEMK
ncbi:MAG: hypothetical protein IJE64_09060 [Methanobrevibacter sp.]|nr:hypothetical protein [Methanobrevibacter sp.]